LSEINERHIEEARVKVDPEKAAVAPDEIEKALGSPSTGSLLESFLAKQASLDQAVDPATSGGSRYA
jgi:hypothetical protein